MTSCWLTGDPIANIKLLEDPGKNLVVIMKDGEVYKKHRQYGAPARRHSQMLTWMRRPTSVIGSKADMARTYQYIR